MSTTILEKFDQLKLWKQGIEEAPHKPLLLLYALGRWHQAPERACTRPSAPLLLLYALGRWHSERAARLSFKDVNRDLIPLLECYGPERASYHPEYPFWRLRNDGIWEVDAFADLSTTASGDPKKSELLAKNVQAGFSQEVLSALEATPELVFQIAQLLLDRYFPSARHQDILAAIGLVA